MKKKKKSDDPRAETASPRVRVYGVTPSQSTSPLAGYLAGVLFLRRRIEAKHLGHFFSYLEMSPSHLKGIEVKEYIQHNNQGSHFGLSRRYMELCRELGPSITHLNELAYDRLSIPVKALKAILVKVPMTKAGYEFSLNCEGYRGPSPTRKTTKMQRAV